MAVSSSSSNTETYTVTFPSATASTPPKGPKVAISSRPGHVLGSAATNDDNFSLQSLDSQGHHQGRQQQQQQQQPAVFPEDGLPPPNAVSQHTPEQWNKPRLNLARTLASFYALFLIGMNDATYGAVLPYMETYYHLSYVVVSLIFLSPLVGYISSALLNPTIHSTLGQRGVAVLSPACHIIAFAVVAVHPPFPVLVVAYILAGFGNGLADAAWNAWVGDMKDANQVLGFLHGVYGAGATVAPLCATTLITKAGLPWYYWYYILLGMAGLELGTSAWAFWGADGREYREKHPRDAGKEGKSRIREALADRGSARVVWLASLFLLGYVGAEVALGGWIVIFMMRERDGNAFASGVAATGFWLGITVGRVVLGFVTPRVGEKRAVAVYLPLAAAMQLLFWLVPSFVVSAVAVGLQGFFLGPLFPAAVVACTKLLPKHLHVSGIGFAAAFGGSGAAIFPFAIGALAQAKGVQVLQPMILALLVTIWGVWLCLPKFPRKTE